VDPRAHRRAAAGRVSAPTHRQLAGDDVHGAAGVALGERLAETCDDGQAIVNGGRRLGGDELVRLALLAALAVAQDGVLEAQVLEHRGAHLARVRASRGKGVLRGHGKVAAQARAHIRQVGVRRRHHHLGARRRLAAVQHAQPLRRLRGAAIRLPVAAHKELRGGGRRESGRIGGGAAASAR